MEYGTDAGVRVGATMAWPPSPEMLAGLAARGIGDRRAAVLFGVHVSTYRSLRRRHRAEPSEAGLDGPPRNPGAYGFDPDAKWPDGAVFTDDPRAACAGRTGRIRHPGTHVETASSIALLAG